MPKQQTGKRSNPLGWASSSRELANEEMLVQDEDSIEQIGIPWGSAPRVKEQQ